MKLHVLTEINLPFTWRKIIIIFEKDGLFEFNEQRIRYHLTREDGVHSNYLFVIRFCYVFNILFHLYKHEVGH